MSDIEEKAIDEFLQKQEAESLKRKQVITEGLLKDADGETKNEVEDDDVEADDTEDEEEDELLYIEQHIGMPNVMDENNEVNAAGEEEEQEDEEEDEVNAAEQEEEEEDEEEDEGEPAMVKEVRIENDVPVYQDNHLLMDERNFFKCVIYERVDDGKGPVGEYFATVPEKELVLKVEKEPAPNARLQYDFLKRVEAANDWLYFAQLHSEWSQEGFYFFMAYCRPGPTLQQIRQFMQYRPFSYSSGGRLGGDVLKCIQLAHKHGMLLGALSDEMLTFDAAGRILILSDLSTLRPQTDVDQTWRGSPVYAPVRSGAGYCARDDLLAWLYFFVEAVAGELPWAQDTAQTIVDSKKQGAAFAELIEGLPKVYKLIKETIDNLPGNAGVSDDVYKKLQEYCKVVYAELGGCTDMDDNLDFERDPLESELPRFVMEKRPIVQEKEDDESKETNEGAGYQADE